MYQGLWNDTAVAIKVIEYKEGSRDAVNPALEASLTKYASLTNAQSASKTHNLSLTVHMWTVRRAAHC